MNWVYRIYVIISPRKGVPIERLHVCVICGGITFTSEMSTALRCSPRVSVILLIYLHSACVMIVINKLTYTLREHAYTQQIFRIHRICYCHRKHYWDLTYYVLFCK